MIRWTAAAGVLLLLAGCGEVPGGSSAPSSTSSATSSAPVPRSVPPSPVAPTTQPAPEPRRSFLTIPTLGLGALPVVRYVGTPDDGPGTRIQDGGPAASPRGPGGGVGPGEIGNFIVTGHRTSHGAPFGDLPDLRTGDRVRVRSGRVLHVYRIVATRETSFRSPRSLAEQAAAVPGRPGVAPTRAMITISTCATPEDHASGNFWSDRFGNPEHRIDKIGVLEFSRAIAPAT